MNKKEVTFNVKYEIVLYAPVFNARCPSSPGHATVARMLVQPL